MVAKRFFFLKLPVPGTGPPRGRPPEGQDPTRAGPVGPTAPGFRAWVLTTCTPYYEIGFESELWGARSIRSRAATELDGFVLRSIPQRDGCRPRWAPFQISRVSSFTPASEEAWNHAFFATAPNRRRCGRAVQKKKEGGVYFFFSFPFFLLFPFFIFFVCLFCHSGFFVAFFFYIFLLFAVFLSRVILFLLFGRFALFRGISAEERLLSRMGTCVLAHRRKLGSEVKQVPETTRPSRPDRRRSRCCV